MRIVIQRVYDCKMLIDGKLYSSIDSGMLVLLGIGHEDTVEDIEWLMNKVHKLRIFDDEAGVMNLSLEDTQKEIMLVSQFTLHASTKKGNRPSYIKAAKPDVAIPLYEKSIAVLESKGIKVSTGVFGADMKVDFVNDGPVTIIIDSKNRE